MNRTLVALFALVVSSFRTRAAFQTEVLALRHQLAILQGNASRRLHLQRSDRLLWILLSRLWLGWRICLQIVQPATVIAWHRRAFAWYGRASPGARRVWGAPCIQAIYSNWESKSQSTVAKYLAGWRKPPSQTWRTFLTNHISQMAAIDFFTAPTATFCVLFVFLVLSHDRRRLVLFAMPKGRLAHLRFAIVGTARS